MRPGIDFFPKFALKKTLIKFTLSISFQQSCTFLPAGQFESNLIYIKIFNEISSYDFEFSGYLILYQNKTIAQANLRLELDKSSSIGTETHGLTFVLAKKN